MMEWTGALCPRRVSKGMGRGTIPLPLFSLSDKQESPIENRKEAFGS
jgi:hypothetical protein